MITITVLAVLIVAQAVLLGGAKVAQTAPMRERAAHVGFTSGAYSRIGVLELLGAAGIAIGVVVPPIGVLAAIGLLVLLTGAVVAHIRAGDRPVAIAPALVVAALVVGYLVALVHAH